MSSVKRKVASRAASSGLGSSATKKSKAAKKIVFLLSPAKSLDFDRSHPCLSSLPSSRTPNLLSETEELLHVMKKKKASELKALFKVSDNLAKLNHERFQTFSKLPVKQAALAFDGQAYQGLRAYDFTEDELLWLDQHLCILSGFYGVIRPLDAIRAYRLEMGTKLVTEKGKDLYSYWGDKITKDLTHGGGGLAKGDVVVNVASAEYSKAVNFSQLHGEGVSLFEMKFPGPAVYAKKARGAIVRYAVENRITHVEDLKGFTGSSGDGWEFVGEHEEKVKKGSEGASTTVYTFQKTKK